MFSLCRVYLDMLSYKSRTYYLQKGQVPCTNVVKVDLYIFPPDLCSIGIHNSLTVCLVVDLLYLKSILSRLIKAVMVLPSKKINPHYAENQPEDKADQQHIHNGWDSAYQGIHNHLY